MSNDDSAARRRLSLITLDQALAGASNIVMAVLAARALTVSSFGLFGILFLVYVMAQGVTRALVSDPLLIHPHEARERVGDAIGTGLALGLAVGALLALVGVALSALDPALGRGLLILAVCMPLLVLQDLGRYLGFALQRPARSLALDLCWLVVMVPGVIAMFVFDARTLTTLIAIWGGSGALAGSLTFLQHRSVQVRLRSTWIAHTWSTSWRYLVSYMSTQGSALVGSVAIGGIAGSGSLGGVRGALVLVRPFMTLQAASVASGVAEIANDSSDRLALRRNVGRTTVVSTTAALVNTVVLLALPDVIGRAVLGETWNAAKPLLLPVALQIVLLALITGVRAGLLGMRGVSTVTKLDIGSTVVSLLLTSAGASVGGALGACWAVAIGQVASTVCYWMVYVSRTVDRRPQRTATGATSLEASQRQDEERRDVEVARDAPRYGASITVQGAPDAT